MEITEEYTEFVPISRELLHEVEERITNLEMAIKALRLKRKQCNCTLCRKAIATAAQQQLLDNMSPTDNEDDSSQKTLVGEPPKDAEKVPPAGKKAPPAGKKVPPAGKKEPPRKKTQRVNREDIF